MSTFTAKSKSKPHADSAFSVPSGYRRTEVGVIPQDWHVKPLQDVLQRGVLGGNYPNKDLETSFPLIKMGNVRRGSFNTSTVEYIPEHSPPNPSHLLKRGDVLFNTRNTLDLVGKVAIWRDELSVAYFNSNLMRLEFNPEVVVSSSYANYALNSDRSISSLRGLATGTTSVAAIYTRDVLQLPFIVPPKPEQLAIARALSDVDGLIGALEKLIAKKRAIKKAAMQQLLTGKTRLPGCTGEWEVKRLGEHLRFQVGFPFLSRYFNQEGEGLRMVKNRDLKADDEIVFYNGPYDANFEVNDGDILVGMDGDFLLCRWERGTALLNQRVGRILPSTSLDPVYAYYALAEPLREIERTTSATTVKHLSHGDVEELCSRLPEIEEQTAIATVLSDMDAEIAALEQRRDKTRQIKQGMMQSLLTGRVRLVKPKPQTEAGV